MPTKKAFKPIDGRDMDRIYEIIDRMFVELFSHSSSEDETFHIGVMKRTITSFLEEMENLLVEYRERGILADKPKQ